MVAPTPRPPSRTGVVIAIVAVLVLFAIVLAALFALVRTEPPRPPPAPSVDMPTTGTLEGGGNASVTITSASAELDLSLFRIDLRDLGASRTIASETLRAGAVYTNGSAAIMFDDAPTSGKLGAGDTFRLRNFPVQVTYSIILVYVPEQKTLASTTIPL